MAYNHEYQLQGAMGAASCWCHVLGVWGKPWYKEWPWQIVSPPSPAHKASLHMCLSCAREQWHLHMALWPFPLIMPLSHAKQVEDKQGKEVSGAISNSQTSCPKSSFLTSPGRAVLLINHSMALYCIAKLFNWFAKAGWGMLHALCALISCTTPNVALFFHLFISLCPLCVS